MNYGWLVGGSAVMSLGLTYWLRRYAQHKSLLDIPNARSSHSVPTPRGGGVAIVVSFLLAIVIMVFTDAFSFSLFMSLAGAGSIIAIIGFMDDHGHIPARWRLLGHFAAAAWGLFWIGGLAPLTVLGVSVDIGFVGHMLAALYIVWVLNLYNFMDGIDGIASVEAICVCVGAAVIYALSGMSQLIWLPLILAAAVSGFLVWNCPPAKIFMGDAGSGFLGVILALFSLQAAWVCSQLFWTWLILLGVFIVDATVTLLRRLVRGERVYEAHRSHAYQFASRRYRKHLPVTLAVGAINVLWLFPIALAVGAFNFDGLAGTAIAYIPLVLLALKFRAGKAERN
ncbi:MAG TPA: glycosyltransferase family 4 protein [Pseudomonas sp.]|uniref:MraY family glycosyltransferase n=1 Tax=Pseudomonas sp. TaxID=306 RepID=UPI002EDB7C4F